MPLLTNKTLLIASAVLASGTSSVFPNLNRDTEYSDTSCDCNFRLNLNLEINGASNCATFSITSLLATEAQKTKMKRKVSLNIEKYSEAIRNADASSNGPIAKESRHKFTAEDYISNMRESSGKILPASEKWYL